MASAEDGLLAQHRLLLAVIDTDWATRLDHKVAAVIIQRYYPKYGNARASLRFISEAVRADRTNVIDSARRLVARGAFSIVREGKGTRPTEYALNFGFPVSGGVGTTSSDPNPSGGVGTTSCGGVGTTTSNPSGGVGTTESYLPESGLQAEIQDRENIDCAPPAAPPGLALGGPTGADGHKREKTPFDELYSAYGHRQKRADARAAYEKLAPDADLHQTMVEAATAWRTHWERQNNPSAPRKTLASWIRDEGFHEDPPAGYVPKERKAKPPKTVREPANDNAEAGDRDVGAFRRVGTFTGTIVDSDVIENGATNDVDVTIGIDVTGDGDPDLHHTIHLQNRNSDKQSRGQRLFADVCHLAGLYSVEETSELHGTRVTFTVTKSGQISYQREQRDYQASSAAPPSEPKPIDTSKAPWRQGSWT